MKNCNKCGMLKPLSDFHKHKGRKDGHTNICKKCQKQIQVKYYQSNKQYIYQRNIKNRNWLAAEVDKLKLFPCKDCGIQYEPFCMDFDHLSNKIMAISKMVHDTFSLDKIKEE